MRPRHSQGSVNNKYTIRLAILSTHYMLVYTKIHDNTNHDIEVKTISKSNIMIMIKIVILCTYTNYVTS